MDYCFSKANAVPHLAVRFSGKEAVIKALKNIGIDNIFDNDIEILNDETGCPRVLIQKEKCKDIIINISLSYCSDKCNAVAMVFRVP